MTSKIKLIVLFLLPFTGAVWAQEKNRQVSLQFFLGRSFHGTGDELGIEYGGAYFAEISRKTFWFAEIGGSIHDGVFPVFYTLPSGELIDGSIYDTSAGFQAVGGLGKMFLRTNRHEITFRAGGLLRYQSSSLADEVQVSYPVATGLKTPVVSFVNSTPKKTKSLGGRGSFSYSYTFKSALFVSLNASLQTDSNGDTLTSTALGFGKKF